MAALFYSIRNLLLSDKPGVTKLGYRQVLYKKRSINLESGCD